MVSVWAFFAVILVQLIGANEALGWNHKWNQQMEQWHTNGIEDKGLEQDGLLRAKLVAQGTDREATLIASKIGGKMTPNSEPIKEIQVLNHTFTYTFI